MVESRISPAEQPVVPAAGDVLVVDDYRMLHVLLAQVVKKVLGEVRVHCALSVEAGLEAARRTPDLELLLLNPSLPQSRFQALQSFHKEFPALPILIVSGNDGQDVTGFALRMGARGYVPRSASQETLERAIRAVAAGGHFIPGHLLADDGTAGSNPFIRIRGTARDALTVRQAEVLRLRVKGKTAREIGHSLGITESTVKQHLNATYRALGVESHAEAHAAVSMRGISLE